MLSSSMGRRPYERPRPRWALPPLPIFLAVPLLGTLPACVSPPPAEDVLAVGFRSPEQTFRSFQTALRADLVDLEYRCLSSGFKRANRVSQLVYAKGREQLLKEQPFFKLAATASIEESQVISPDRVRLTAVVEALWYEKRFHVDLVREDFYETFDAEGRLEDDYAVWSELLSRDGRRLVLEVPMPEGTGLDELTEVRAGREWKIDGFGAIAEADPTPPAPANP